MEKHIIMLPRQMEQQSAKTFKTERKKHTKEQEEKEEQEEKQRGERQQQGKREKERNEDAQISRNQSKIYYHPVNLKNIQNREKDVKEKNKKRQMRKNKEAQGSNRKENKRKGRKIIKYHKINQKYIIIP